MRDSTISFATAVACEIVALALFIAALVVWFAIIDTARGELIWSLPQLLDAGIDKSCVGLCERDQWCW